MQRLSPGSLLVRAFAAFFVAAAMLVVAPDPTLGVVKEKCDPLAKYYCARADATWSGSNITVHGSWNKVGTPAPDYGQRSLSFVQYGYQQGSSTWFLGFHRNETLWRSGDPLATQPYYCSTCTSQSYTSVTALRIVTQLKWYHCDSNGNNCTISYEPTNPFAHPITTLTY
jgi:hypothetical protein